MVMSHSKVPFNNLRRQNDEVRTEILAAIDQILDESSFVGGKWVQTFEEEFAKYCGSRYAVACATGTDALKLALLGAGVEPGHEVITVAHTFIATAEAIEGVGATVRFVDIDPRYYTLSPRALGAWLEKYCEVRDGRTYNRSTGKRVAAVLPVHLYGLTADIAGIEAVLAAYPMMLVEDACQAHGAARRVGGVEKRAGTFGVAAAFSFYPGKNLGALGEGGAVATNDETVRSVARSLRAHGEVQRYVHETALGWNARLASVQAAALLMKLRRLEDWNCCRRQIASWYKQRLEGDERIALPEVPSCATHVYHLYVIRVKERERLRSALSEKGVETGLHYPVPLHLQPAYAHLSVGRGSLPVTEDVADTVLSLPMFPHMSEEDAAYVSDCVKKLVA